MRLKTRRYRGHIRPPLTFYVLAVTAWQIEKILAWNFWQSLSKSRFSRPTAFRQTVLLYRGDLDAIPAWLVRAFPVKEIIVVIEDLVLEGLLSRQDGTAISDSIFRCIKKGEWK